MRLRAIVEYDGTDFGGWQRQRGVRTVQGVLEEAWASVTAEVPQVVGAGRTDAGVHATGQVAHIDTIWDRSLEELQRAVNARLPADVVVRQLDEAPPGFHARYSALARVYTYAMYPAAVRSPLWRRTSLFVPGELNLDRMAQAAGQLVGEHDFGAFGRPTKAAGSTRRRVLRFEVGRRGPLVVCQVEANAFLRHMVRRMVGLLLDVGRGRLELEVVGSVLRRAPEAPVPRRLPAHGLTLVSVRYPPDEMLAGGLAVQEGWPTTLLPGRRGEDQQRLGEDGENV